MSRPQDEQISPRIIFDLDDTLLVSSWTHHEQWSFSEYIPVTSCWPRLSIDHIVYTCARRRLIGFFFRSFERRLPPTVEVQLRPGAISMLERLRSQGFELALVTASARVRVHFLSKVFKDFFSIFVDSKGIRRVYAAEDIIASYARLNFNAAGFADSIALHTNERPSLAHKTPLLISQMINGWGGYDLLVDDSTETKEIFSRYGMAGKLLSVDGNAHPLSNLLGDTESVIQQRMADCEDLESDVISSEDLLTAKGITRQLDPFYISTLRRTLEF